MDATDRARLMGNDLTEAVEALVRLFWPAETRAPAVVGDFLAVLINRVTSLTASTLLGVIERQDRLEERVAALEVQLARHVGQVIDDAQVEAEGDGG